MRVLVFGLAALAVIVRISVIGLQFTTHGVEGGPPSGPRRKFRANLSIWATSRRLGLWNGQ
jgi:hypothetical protein